MDTDKDRHEFHELARMDFDGNPAGFEFVPIREIRVKNPFPARVHPWPFMVRFSHI